MGNTRRVIPDADVPAIWDPGSVSKYPDEIRVRMADGHTVTYRLEIQQPGFVAAMEILKRPMGSYPYKKDRRL